MNAYAGYLFDLDGTVYLGDELLDGVRETIETIRGGGSAVRFVTNNPTRTPSEYADRLTGLGIPTQPGDVVTSVTATIRWLHTNHAGALVYPIGEPALIDELDRAGIVMSQDPSKIDIVLASFDRTFDYAKLQIGFDALWFYKRAILVSTNPDRFCPYPGGRGEPDAAAIVGALEASTGVGLYATFGKPSALLAELAIAGLTGPGGGPLLAEDCLMTGDRLGTDIAMGVGAGMDTALVLTGDSTRAEAEAAGPAERPTFVCETLADILSLAPPIDRLPQ